MNTYLYNHTDENTAYVVDNYPYGFRSRTKIRYWIETTNYGDRFCRQTLNPKTNKWNKPKKSTYSAVMVMFLNANKHVTYDCFDLGWSNEEKIKSFLSRIGGIDKLNEQQVAKAKKGIAISRTQEKISYTIEPVSRMTEEEKTQRDNEQKEASKTINKYYSYQLHKLNTETI